MKLEGLQKNWTIVARHPIRSLREEGEHCGKAYVDYGDNNRFDLQTKAPGRQIARDPILSADLAQLRDFAKNNKTGRILTRDDIGELSTTHYTKESRRSAGNSNDLGFVTFMGPPKEWEEESYETKLRLTEAAQDLNPFPNHPVTNWAIDVGDDKHDPQLYLLSSKAN